MFRQKKIEPAPYEPPIGKSKNSWQLGVLIAAGSYQVVPQRSIQCYVDRIIDLQSCIKGPGRDPSFLP